MKADRSTRSADSAGTSAESVPLLETITHNDLDTIVGSAVCVDDIEDTKLLELDFLTALSWAPDATARTLLAALTTPGVDDGSPRGAGLFSDARHGCLFELMLALAADGIPATPQLLHHHALDRGHRELRPILIALAAPEHRPLPATPELPHLAAALVDQWFRRGFLTLTQRLATAVATEPADALHEHWTALSRLEARAARRRTAIRTALVDLP